MSQNFCKSQKPDHGGLNTEPTQSCRRQSGLQQPLETSLWFPAPRFLAGGFHLRVQNGCFPTSYHHSILGKKIDVKIEEK